MMMTNSGMEKLRVVFEGRTGTAAPALLETFSAGARLIAMMSLFRPNPGRTIIQKINCLPGGIGKKTNAEEARVRHRTSEVEILRNECEFNN